ncbi:MAG: hypothetical protein WD270_10385 [Acetobacterales bacterium]
MSKYSVPRDRKHFRLSEVEMPPPLRRVAYERQLREVQETLRHIQIAYRRSGDRAVVVFEGWDAAGKGGTIRRFSFVMDPRGFHVWPIAAPTPHENGHHFLYRFWTRLPDPGGIAVFDRSWYGRVLVERVEELATPKQWKRAYREINEFERMLVDDGVRLVKLFLHITPDEQLNRLLKRITDPVKRWKVTAEDFRNRARWDDYEDATEDMIRQTTTKRAPWHVIPGNDKKLARIAALRIIAGTLSRGVDISTPSLDPAVAEIARDELGLDV